MSNIGFDSDMLEKLKKVLENNDGLSMDNDQERGTLLDAVIVPVRESMARDREAMFYNILSVVKTCLKSAGVSPGTISQTAWTLEDFFTNNYGEE